MNKVEIINDHKTCSKCKNLLHVDSFCKLSSNSSGYNSWCRLCEKKRKKDFEEKDSTYLDRRRATNRKSYEKYLDKNKLSKWNSALKTKYGINIEDFQEMVLAQDNKCLGCNLDFSKHPRRPSIDHDHKTGRVRGLLCDSCNKALGLLKDDILILQSLINYLKNYE